MTAREEMGVIVFGHTRAQHLQVLLESLHRQAVDCPVHVWLDGHHGRLDVKERVARCVTLVRQRYPWVHLTTLNGQIGIEKMTLDGLSYMCGHYEKIIVLEDDCFPTSNCIGIFSECLDRIRHEPEIYSVYGHHFNMPSEQETITRFQGWGWASTREKILPILSELRTCFDMAEEEYLKWVKQSLTPEIEQRLNVTPPRNCLVPLSQFFCWDACTALLTAMRGLVHRKTPQRVIYNCGMGKESTHFKANPILREPPYNMITVDEVWDYYNSDAPDGEDRTDHFPDLQKLFPQIHEGRYMEGLAALDGEEWAERIDPEIQAVLRIICLLGTKHYEDAKGLFVKMVSGTTLNRIGPTLLAMVACSLSMKHFAEARQLLLNEVFYGKGMTWKAKQPLQAGDSSFPATLWGESGAKRLADMLIRPTLEPLFDDELYYRVGVEMHHTADQLKANAARVYQTMIKKGVASPHLRAWAHYKYGEILMNNNGSIDAEEQFRMAVQLDPDHAKARIALLGNTELRVLLSSRKESFPGHISIRLDIYDRKLWDYYFQGERIQSARIRLPCNSKAEQIESLFCIAEKYLAQKCVVSFLWDEDKEGNGLLEKIKERLEGARFVVEYEKNTISAFRA